MYVPPLGSWELGGFNELITSRFGRHLKNWMLGFPVQILPMMGFLSCNNSNIFQWPKLVSIGGSCSEPFSHLQHVTQPSAVCDNILLWISAEHQPHSAEDMDKVCSFIVAFDFGLCWPICSLTNRLYGLTFLTPRGTQGCMQWSHHRWSISAPLRDVWIHKESVPNNSQRHSVQRL